MKPQPEWKLEPNEGYVMVKLAASLRSETVKDFEAAMKPFIGAEGGTTAPVHIVLHCGELRELPASWIRAIIQLQKNSRSAGKHLKLIQVAPTVLATFKMNGVEGAIPILPSLREALMAFGIVTKRSVDVGFINPFLAAVMRVLQIQATVESKPGRMILKTDKKRYLGDISGVIGLVSDAFNGSVVISFPERTFLNLMEKMIGEKFTTISKEIEDGAAELTNMVFGQAKIVLNEKGYGLKTAIPSVVIGQNHSVQTLAQGPTVVVPFETEVGSFYVEISLAD